MSRKIKRAILTLIDAILIGISFITAYFFLNLYVTASQSFYLMTYSLAAVCYLIIGRYLKVFSRLNRYTNTKEIFSLFLTITLAYLLSFTIALALNMRTSMRIMALTYLFSLLLIPASRLSWRFLIEHYAKKEVVKEHKKRTLVVGAGAGSNILFKHLELENVEYNVVGIIDDDLNKRGTYLYNVPIVGTVNDIAKTVEKLKIEHIIVAIPSIKPKKFEEILDISNQLKITINSLPPVNEVLASDFTIKKLRNIEVADLLGRDEVKLDMKGLAHALTEKVLLVTGAGGSIGSEICRQVSRFRPRKLILLGHGENSIYEIHRELFEEYNDNIELVPIIADIQDRDKMFEIMEHYRPDIVYHAASHKHVPLMEVNPIEAVKNNIYGTKNVAEAAKSAEVNHFVMVSTDKAVNPPNVMGATKRIAEMIITGLNEENSTNFCAVRFGNVLGSRGSVVPLFKEQIAKGGPVTVTDYRMTRYFMTIPEASRLVIQAGVLAKGGEILVLDMGAPVKIYNLAKKIIKLSGFNEEQIPIIETGIRPGEKLFEELLLTSEQTGENIFEKIFVGKVPVIPLEDVMAFVESLKDDRDLKERLIYFANNLKCSKANE